MTFYCSSWNVLNINRKHSLVCLLFKTISSKKKKKTKIILLVNYNRALKWKKV